jgi:hypothetical protein
LRQQRVRLAQGRIIEAIGQSSLLVRFPHGLLEERIGQIDVASLDRISRRAGMGN